MTKNGERVNVLLVEDDDVDAETVIRGLSKRRISNPVIHALDGLEALDYLRGTGGRSRVARPRVVLLDLHMPRMDGLGFLDAIRSDADLEDTVVFMLTTSADDEDRSKAYRRHIAGYMLKSEVGPSFKKAAKMLHHYWRAVSLPGD